MVLAIGKLCAHIFMQALAATISYLHCLGAKVTAKKCFSFGTAETIREDLRHHWWTHIGTWVDNSTLANCSVPAPFLPGLLPPLTY